MPISRYPRPGQRLAPASLGDLLHAPVPRRLIGWADKDRIRFADLDETAWTRFGAACRPLAKALVQEVQGRISPPPAAVRDRVIPHLPGDVQIEDLELETRTYNCLWTMQDHGLPDDAHELGGKTIGQLLAVRGFGAKCLVDLLTSIESVVPSPPLPLHFGGARGPEVPVAGPQCVTDLPAGYSLCMPISAIRNVRLPRLQEGVKVSDLRLSNRTLNCLVRQGLHERLRDLEDYTLGQLLELPGFGKQCLADLIAAFNAFSTGTALQPVAPPELSVASEVVLDTARTSRTSCIFSRLDPAMSGDRRRPIATYSSPSVTSDWTVPVAPRWRRSATRTVLPARGSDRFATGLGNV